MNDNKVIRVTCGFQETLDPRSIKNLQGNLKEKTRDQLDKLKRQIIKHGFSFPLFVWRNGKTAYSIDGHGRQFVSEEFISEGYGFRYPGGEVKHEVPIVWIEARDKREAKEKLLALNSSYGRVTEEGLHEYVEDLDIESLMPNLDLQDVNLDVFKFRLTGDVVDDPFGEWKGMPEFVQEDKSAFRTIRVHFRNQKAVDDFAELMNQKITDKTKYLWHPRVENERYVDKEYVDES